MKHPRLMRRRESGVLLLMVALLLATLAALSFSLNRGAGSTARVIQDEYDIRAAGYLAEAGVAAARWKNQVAGCTNAAIPVTALGTGSFTATVAKAPSKRLNIVATGTMGSNAARTLTRNEVNIVDFTKTETKELGGNVMDAWIDTGAGTLLPSMWTGMSYINSADITLTTNRAYGLLYWATTDIRTDAQVMSATLSLTLNGAGSVVRQVAVQRMMTAWDQNVTGARPTSSGQWTGSDFGSLAVATAGIPTGVTNTTYTWDVTGLVDGWNSGRLANYGMLLRLLTPNQSVTFYSRDGNSSNRRPALRVTTAKAC